jgi:putative MATE family efflux protein
MKKVLIELNRFVLPLLAGNVMQLVIGQLALSFAGKLSYENIPAITTMSNLLFSITGILGVIAVAFNMISSKSLGENNTDRFKRLISSIIGLSLIIGLASIIVIVIGSGYLLQRVYHFEGQLFTIAQGYLYSMSPFILLTLLSFALTNLIKVEKKTNYIFAVSVISLIVQTILSYLLINGAFIFPKLGVIGAGIAEITALFVSVLIYAFLVRNLLSDALKNKPTEIKNILKRSVPLIFQELLEGVLFIIIFEALISRIGVLTLTSYSLLLQGLNYAKLPTFMYSNSLFVFISEAYGERNARKVNQNMIGAVGLSALFYFLISLLFIFNCESFASFFTSDGRVIEYLSQYIVLGSICIFTTVFYETMKATLLSLEKEKVVLLVTTIVYFIAIAVLSILSYFDILGFSLALIIYGINYFILDIVFIVIFLGNKNWIRELEESVPVVEL